MKKNNDYYEGRLVRAGYERDEKMTKGKSSAEIVAILDELNAESSVARISRIGVNLNEAFAIIRALLSDPEPTDPGKIHHIEWIDRMSAIPKDAKGDLLKQDWTRAQMLDRLHWISSEEFGEDLDEWTSWMTAFLENPPAWGWR